MGQWGNGIAIGHHWYIAAVQIVIHVMLACVEIGVSASSS